MMKKIITGLFILAELSLTAQDNTGAEKFWNTLRQNCGKAFEGEIAQVQGNNDFTGKKIIMHVRLCKDGQIRIPFIVGEDKSRTWVLSYEAGRIGLKHDHRHKDGTADSITHYGGIAANSGLPNMQVFPADQYTCELISNACSNVWWITIDEKSFSYNLRRIGSDRLFSVRFDLTKPVDIPEAPWGWAD